MKQVYLEKYQQGGYKIYRVPSIVCTDKGTIVVCYECRYGGDWSAMDLVIRRSTDGGETWSDRVVMASGREIDAVHNGILFADGGALHLIWHRNYRQAYHTVSLDEGATWSEPKDISYAYEALRGEYNWTVIAAGPGHGLVTSAGRMIIPVWVAANRENINDHHPSVATTLYSDDHGETWRCGEIIWNQPDFVDPNESVLAELLDGSFMINCRHETGTGTRKVGFSPDGISGWHGFYFDSQLYEPVCCAGMTQGDGWLWFTNCVCPHGVRDNLSIRTSADGGRTWSAPHLLDAKGGYSDVFYSPKTRRLYVAAETGRADPEQTWTFGLSVLTLDPEELG